jgi:hypothetical protein
LRAHWLAIKVGNLFRWDGRFSNPPIIGSLNTKGVGGFDWHTIARQDQQITIPDVDLQGLTGGERLLDQQSKTHSGSEAHQLPARIVALSKSCLNL